MGVVGLDHVQVAIPAGGGDEARAFYAGLLGLVELSKPAALAGRGGCCALGAGPTAAQLHLGVEESFRAAAKAHPGLLVDGLAELLERLSAAGVPVVRDVLLPGVDRAHVSDPFGRLELLQPAAGSATVAA